MLILMKFDEKYARYNDKVVLIINTVSENESVFCAFCESNASRNKIKRYNLYTVPEYNTPSTLYSS